MDRVLSWIDREPVITRMGSVIALIVAYLVARGVLDTSAGDVVGAVLAIILGGGGIGVTRAAVTPTAKLNAPSGGAHAQDDTSG